MQQNNPKKIWVKLVGYIIIADESVPWKKTPEKINREIYRPRKKPRIKYNPV